MITDFIKGVTGYFDAMAFIRANKLQRYFVYSGLIGLLALALIAFFISISYHWLSALMLSWIPWDIGRITDVLSIVLMSTTFFIIFKYIMLILTAPLMSVLSEKVEMIIAEDYEERGFGISIILGDLFRGLRIAARNVIRELFYTLILFIVSLFIPFTVLTTPAVFLVQSYFAGFGNFDFWAERHFTYGGTIDFMKDHRPLVAGNGLPYVLLLTIPLLGPFLAPPLSTVAATIAGHKKRLALIG